MNFHPMVWGAIVVAAFYVGFLVCAIFAGRPKRTPKPAAPPMGALLHCVRCAEVMAVPLDSQVRGIAGVDEWYLECLNCGAVVCVQYVTREQLVARESAVIQ